MFHFQCARESTPRRMFTSWSTATETRSEATTSGTWPTTWRHISIRTRTATPCGSTSTRWVTSTVGGSPSSCTTRTASCRRTSAPSSTASGRSAPAQPRRARASPPGSGASETTRRTAAATETTPSASSQGGPTTSWTARGN